MTETLRNGNRNRKIISLRLKTKRAIFLLVSRFETRSFECMTISPGGLEYNFIQVDKFRCFNIMIASISSQLDCFKLLLVSSIE